MGSSLKGHEPGTYKALGLKNNQKQEKHYKIPGIMLSLLC